MNNPPHVSMVFFVAAGAIIIAMFWAANTDHQIQPSEIDAAKASRAQYQAERIRQFTDGWTGEVDFTPVFNALDPSFDIAETTSASFDPNDDYFGLPRTEGYETVYGLCGACHSLRIVMQQHATLERWSELLLWMTEKQGMPQLSDEDEALVAAYLAEHFGATE